ncbi:nicotinate-nucleotide adenylyltransferase [Alkalicoccus saliphilus]|jgi:nicotinate-nucleotide adenylyltransferase|uniref:Probable nicotinate-nucleotide adenylyltransferase n=1 Tax=Alkalicoccus saliphilus TaxID=200989 RepID=A0A2T4UAZ8_9BACI|nr:nicotinate-nucleotide adenylyltransferase [Alkalicoccus saliphilus]PTL40572.1 nicotinate (nicotinamide) nucleotide adenylyltransferase [Alkalicoccus saliphilus]
MKKIGLLGGTFDPPHTGHLIMAEEARLEVELDEVWWMPNKIPPHKARTDTTEEQRIDMVKHMVRLSSSFQLCLKEMEREGPSYTTETLQSLLAQYPEDKFYFIMGGDSYENFHLWNNYEKLQQLISFIVMKRPGTAGAQVKEKDFKEILFLNQVELNISSTALRDRASTGMWNKFLVTEDVDAYIKEQDLYE